MLKRDFTPIIRAFSRYICIIHQTRSTSSRDKKIQFLWRIRAVVRVYCVGCLRVGEGRFRGVGCVCFCLVCFCLVCICLVGMGAHVGRSVSWSVLAYGRSEGIVWSVLRRAW